MNNDGSSPSSSDAASRCLDVFAVVVTYQPDLDVLRQVLDSVKPQVGGVLLFDNASNSAAFLLFLRKSNRKKSSWLAHRPTSGWAPP